MLLVSHYEFSTTLLLQLYALLKRELIFLNSIGCRKINKGVQRCVCVKFTTVRQNGNSICLLHHMHVSYAI